MIKNIPSKLEKNNIENLNKVKYKKNQSSKLLEHPPLPPQKKTTKKNISTEHLSYQLNEKKKHSNTNSQRIPRCEMWLSWKFASSLWWSASP